jgi:hypothetical protein
VRPKDAPTPDGELGPLGFMEKEFVDFINTIRSSENERARTNTLRPKDLNEDKRGPFGKAELIAVSAIREILDAERIRMEQSRLRGGAVVRPIDVPGPLGNFEMAVLDVVSAEQQRKLEGEGAGFSIRPMKASVKGPLGELEQQAVAAVQRLTNEEKERLRNIQRFLDDNRPMEKDRLSILGIFEAIIVGILRAPMMLMELISRVSELLRSEVLSEDDDAILRQQQAKEEVVSSKKRRD